MNTTSLLKTHKIETFRPSTIFLIVLKLKNIEKRSMFTDPLPHNTDWAEPPSPLPRGAFAQQPLLKASQASTEQGIYRTACYEGKLLRVPLPA